MLEKRKRDGIEREMERRKNVHVSTSIFSVVYSLATPFGLVREKVDDLRGKAGEEQENERSASRRNAMGSRSERGKDGDEEKERKLTFCAVEIVKK